VCSHTPMVWAQEGLHRVRTPDSWPASPATMFYSTMLAIERCPRAWALVRAEHCGISGYPEKPTVGAVRGRVIHRALERCALAMCESGNSSVDAVSIVTVLRALGGLSKILVESAAEEMAILAQNPRASSHLDDYDKALSQDLPKMRSTLQQMLRGTDIAQGSVRTDHGAGASPRALGEGSHPEQWVEASDLGWAGIVDLLTLSPSGCVMTDFKTGVLKPEHEFQVRVYATIWALDSVRNPDSRLATELRLTYPTQTVQVSAPTRAEVEVLTAELRQRASAARSEVEQNPPPARPEPETCRWCQTRQLCEEYWAASVGWQPESLAAEQMTDLEFASEGHDGASFLAGTALRGGGAAPGTRVLIRVGDSASSELARAGTLRCTGILRLRDDDPSRRMFVSTKETELFVV